ncbi:MAG: hypothetical protein WKF77_11935 [Planctomycetaceae bacterium]
MDAIRPAPSLFHQSGTVYLQGPKFPAQLHLLSLSQLAGCADSIAADHHWKESVTAVLDTLTRINRAESNDESQREWLPAFLFTERNSLRKIAQCARIMVHFGAPFD